MIAGWAGAALALSLAACGGSASTSYPASTPHTASISAAPGAATLTAWSSKTQQLCVQKQAAIARLGSVNITYGGIARLGLPAVKRLLDGYLGRLLAVLREFYGRQQQIPTPPSVAPTLSRATALSRQSQAATVQLQAAVAKAQTAAQLSSAFNAWIATLRRLSARGDALAQQLNLPACRSAG